MAAVAVAGIASEPAPTPAQQVLLIAVVVIAALAVVCDVLAWRLERADPQPTGHPTAQP